MITTQVNGETILHNEGHPERFTELHGEQKEERDRGNQEEKRGSQKGREQFSQ